MGLWNLTFSSYGALKGGGGGGGGGGGRWVEEGGYTFLFSTGQLFCRKRLFHIVAISGLKRFRIVTQPCFL